MLVRSAAPWFHDPISFIVSSSSSIDTATQSCVWRRAFFDVAEDAKVEIELHNDNEKAAGKR